MLLDPVLLQARVGPEFVCRVVHDLLDEDPECAVDLLSGDDPFDDAVFIDAFAQRAWRAHPVERLERTVIAVDGDGTVRLHEDQSVRHGQMGRKPSGIVDLAAGNDEPHLRLRLTLPREGAEVEFDRAALNRALVRVAVAPYE